MYCLFLRYFGYQNSDQFLEHRGVNGIRIHSQQKSFERKTKFNTGNKFCRADNTEQRNGFKRKLAIKDLPGRYYFHISQYVFQKSQIKTLMPEKEWIQNSWIKNNDMTTKKKSFIIYKKFTILIFKFLTKSSQTIGETRTGTTWMKVHTSTARLYRNSTAIITQLTGMRMHDRLTHKRPNVLPKQSKRRQ